jgi:hypothetical protein
MIHIGDDFSRLASFDTLTIDQEEVLDQMGNELELERLTTLENDAEIESLFSMYEHGNIYPEF